MTASFAAILLMLANATEEDNKKAPAYPRTDMLIEVSDLIKLAKSRTVRLLDTQRLDQFGVWHAEGAQWVDAAEWGRIFAKDQETKTWAKLIGDQGIDVDTAVVVYGDKAVNDAARVWWILKFWGIKDVRLLNGGLRALKNAGSKELGSNKPMVVTQAAKVSAVPGRLATKAQVLDVLSAKSAQIIDARTTAEYCGELVTAKRAGAIPGAIHLDWAELIDSKTTRFKTAEELTNLFRDRHIDLEQPLVTHCQSGGRSAAMAFALELMGAKHVQNYYKSWAEWGNADDTPVEKPMK
jgi:thiosulfate/3-mercaptopyruvate sulfurtransferase